MQDKIRENVANQILADDECNKELMSYISRERRILVIPVCRSWACWVCELVTKADRVARINISYVMEAEEMVTHVADTSVG